MRGAALAMAVGTSAVVLGATAPGIAQQRSGPPPGRSADPTVVALKTRTFTPPARLETDDIERRGGPQRAHFFLQFDDVPDTRGKRRAKDQDVELLASLGGATYLASARRGAVGRVRNVPGVRWAAPIPAADKVDPALVRGEIGPHARRSDGRVALTVQVHADETVAAARAAVRAHGGTIVGQAPTIPSVTALLRPGVLADLAAEDAVVAVSVADPPLQNHNDGARGALGVGPLAAAPYGLTGAGVRVMVYDSGIADAVHPDFAGRIAQTDGDASVPTRSHSTHVAGTALGSGANSNGNDSAGNPNGGTANQWAGMAPGATLATFGSQGSNSSTDVLYDDAGDLTADAATAIGGGIDLQTMSLGNNTGSNGFPCAQLGDYTNTSIALDDLVNGGSGGQQLTYFQSAGNERNDGCAPSNGFSTISSPAPAKNTIVVGATNSNDNTQTAFSSWGPVDDGRLRPDVVGPGCQSSGDFTITSTDFNDDGDGNLEAGETQSLYRGKCGTSMATPAVAGTMALVVQQWRANAGPGTRPLPHTAKALLAHTATDLGTAGPDFSNGFGHVSGQAAVDLVRADAVADRITVDSVAQGTTDFWSFSTDASTPARVTLAWSDPTATRMSATQLVNDLDLRLRAPDGTTVQPLVLDPANPGNAAVQGNDNRNPIEMVVPGAPQEGTWVVTVGGTSVPSGPQAYTLITPGDADPGAPPIADAGGPYSTPEGTDVTVTAAGSSDPEGEALTYAWDLDDDGAFDDATGVTATFTRVGDDGSFPVRVRVTDAGGSSATDAATVTVANVAPVSSPSVTSPRPEGSLVTLSGTGTDPGWQDALTATVDWGDGTSSDATGAIENVRPDATLTLAATHRYADNGSYTVHVCVTDDHETTCADRQVTITNVAPVVTVDAGQVTRIDEGGSVGVSATFTDPGWADSYSAMLDWGTAPLPDAAEPGLIEMLAQGPPEDRGRVSESHTYGDDGAFPVQVSVTDDDGGTGTAGFALTVDNVAPTAEIDESTATSINGQTAFLAPAGQPVPFAGDSEDPGSDDLTISWDWDTSQPPPADESREYLANAPLPDGDPSPAVQPRDVTDTTSHAFAQACLYEIALRSADDDGGAAQDTAAVLITGTAQDNRGDGYWYQQTGPKKSAAIAPATMDCYLAIVGFASRVFDETRDVSTRAKARALLNPGGGPVDIDILDRQLLALWLNFANGATDWGEQVDTDGDGTADTPLSEVLEEAEDLRLSPAATRSELLALKNLLEAINLRDE